MRLKITSCQPRESVYANRQCIPRKHRSVTLAIAAKKKQKVMQAMDRINNPNPIDPVNRIGSLSDITTEAIDRFLGLPPRH